MKIMKNLTIFLLSLLPAFLCPTANAAWPNDHVIKIIVPFPAGGSSDILARITADSLSASLKQSVIVINQAGASGVIAAEAVARAPADGYTLFMASSPQLVTGPLTEKTSYDPLKDFALITLLGTNTFALTAQPSFPAKTLPELVSYAKSRPGEITYAAGGKTGVLHLTMALLAKQAGISMTPVSYKGMGAAVMDLLSGHVAMAFTPTSDVLQQVKAGKLKAIAVSDIKRSSYFPGVPTIAEQGFPSISLTNWTGLAAPAGTPATIVDKLTSEIKALLKDPAFVAKLNAIGVDPSSGGSEEFTATLRADIKKWSDILKQPGLGLD